MKRTPALYLAMAWVGLAVVSQAAEGGERKDRRLSHWSYQPVRKVTPPGDPKGHPADGFISRKLAEAGLKMSPEAGRRTLIRRLSFDLHGLPPSPEAVERFKNDPDPEAYEKLVDTMLDSPHYGERFARHWLDIAHYADTHGFERDRRRDHAWRYRDYVIGAFNEDKPYHRFLQEQIAGDVLWPDDVDAVTATGFLAAGPWDFVGQVETKSPVLRRAARALDLDDMTTQVMTSTMAITMNCARCHNHKLDPISQEEYYRLRAVFAGVKRADKELGKDATAGFAARRAELLKEANALEPGIDLADIVGGGDGKGSGVFKQGIDPRSGKVEARPMGFLDKVVPNRFSKSDNRFVDGVFIPHGEDGKAKIPISSTGLTVGGIPSTDAKAWDAVRNGPVNSQHSNELGGTDFTKGDASLLGLHANAGITFDLAELRKVTGGEGLRFSAQVGYFGMQADPYFADAWVFIDGEKVAEFRKLKRADGLKMVDIPIPEKARYLTLMSTDGGNAISHDQIGFGNPKLLSARSKLSAAGRVRLAELRKEIGEIDAKIGSLGAPKVFAVTPLPKVPEVRVQRRGDPESEIGDPMEPGAVAAMAMLDPDLGSHESTEAERRAALAKWIADPKNPLAARVIANRLWHWHFGKGIVDTPSDFGLGGGRPSHPELLDWLASELQRRGWSLKAIHRIILTSAAYKQESRFVGNEKGVSVDAGNRLLWRQNPRRIEAEAVRDSVLFVSGKLNIQRGGPGFEDFKYQEAYAPIYTYVTADGPKLWRRSIYRYIVRTTPDRFLTTLDCPDPANFTPKRLTTTTPLQSLALYNNDFMLRQAGYFAERVKKEAGDGIAGQVGRAFWIAFGRKPSKEELRVGAEFVDDQSLFAFCRSLLNANEFVYVD